jgi:hypothetical protein
MVPSKEYAKVVDTPDPPAKNRVPFEETQRPVVNTETIWGIQFVPSNEKRSPEPLGVPAASQIPWAHIIP